MPREITLDDIRAVSTDRNAVTVERDPYHTDRVQTAATAGQEKPSKWEFVKAVGEQDFIGPILARTWGDVAGHPLDADWSLEKDVSEEEFAELTEGLDEGAQERLARRARSREHLYVLAGEAKHSLEQDELTAQFGGWGIASRLGLQLVDPGNLALAVATGGASVGVRAEKMRRAALAATTLADRQAVAASGRLALNAGHTRNVLTTAAIAGTENAIIESLAASTNVTRDGWDVAVSTVGGVALGAAAGRYLSGKERTQLRNMTSAAEKRLAEAEFASRAATLRAERVAQLGGDVDAARLADVADTGRVGSWIAGRDTDMDSYDGFVTALESGGRADAAASTSSAVGLHQFVKSTWLGYVRKLKPAWAEGLSEADVLAKRTDPEASKEVFDAFTADNVEALRRAGAPVNQFTAYAAHHFGPRKGAVFAKASDDTSMDDILTKAQLDANPYLRGKTKAEAIAIWSQRARNHGVDLGGILDRVPGTPEEAARIAQLENFDEAGARTRLAEISAELDEHRLLTEQGSKALSGKETNRLLAEQRRLESALNGHRGSTVGRAEAALTAARKALDDLHAGRAARLQRALEEDELKLGKAEANTKARQKLREKHDDHATRSERLRRERAVRDAIADVKAVRRETADALAAVKGHAQRAKGAADAKARARTLGDDLSARGVREEAAALREALGLRERVAADAEAREELKALLKASEGRSKALRDLDAFTRVKDEADFNAELLRIHGRAPTYGEDTLSAARAAGLDYGLYPHLAEAVEGVQAPQMKLSAWTRMFGRGTFSGVLRGSEHPIVRKLLGPLVGNPLGNERRVATEADVFDAKQMGVELKVGDLMPEEVTEIGASEIRDQIARGMDKKFGAAVDATYGKWLKEQGIGAARYYDRNVRNDFMREVGLLIRGGENESPHVKEMARRLSGLLAEFLDMAKEAGVKGFDDVQSRDDWLPRVFNHEAIYGARNRIGSEELDLLVARSIQQVREGLDDKTAMKVAKAWLHSLAEQRLGTHFQNLHGMSFDDVGFLREFLGKAGLASNEVEDVVAQFASATAGAANKPVLKKEGSFRHAKARLGLDESFAMDFVDRKSPDGSVIPVSISSLLENNVEQLYGRYSRTMSGHIALARKGIKSRGDFDDRMKKVAHALEGHKDDWEQTEKYANAAYDLITGRPLHKASVWSELMRTLRDAAYLSQMENAGWANTPDLAALLSWGNIRYTTKAFFNGEMFGTMWKRGEDGRLVSEFHREIEEFAGLGGDMVNNQVFSSYDVMDDYSQSLVDGSPLVKGASGLLSATAHGARVVSRGVTYGSGLAGIMSFGNRVAAYNIVYRLKDQLFKGGKFSDARMLGLGIDKPMQARIEAQMREHTVWVKGGEDGKGGDIQRINFAEWDDIEARDAFLYAVHREVRKNIQEEDIGDTFYWQHHPIGKVAAQFRRFGLAAYTKQTLRGIAEGDIETMTRAAMQMLLAAGVWKARHEAVAYGMELAGADQEAIDKYRERNLAPDRIVAASIRNSGVASLLPDVYDSTIGFATQPFFDVRHSGNSSNGLSGIPGVAWGYNAITAVGGTLQAVTRGDRQFTQGTARAWQALAPFGHHLLTGPAFEAAISTLPESHEDDDPDDFQWFWQ